MTTSSRYFYWDWPAEALVVNVLGAALAALAVLVPLAVLAFERPATLDDLGSDPRRHAHPHHHTHLADRDDHDDDLDVELQQPLHHHHHHQQQQQQPSNGALHL